MSMTQEELLNYIAGASGTLASILGYLQGSCTADDIGTSSLEFLDKLGVHELEVDAEKYATVIERFANDLSARYLLSGIAFLFSTGVIQVNRDVFNETYASIDGQQLN